MKKLTVGGFFSGIGGVELGLVRAGFNIAWMIEKDDYCQRVLKKNAPTYWPNAEIYGDINDLEEYNLSTVDVICGGFPCQPFSDAGKKLGRDDERYLWPSMLGGIRKFKPRWVIGENVAGFIGMELENAFADLEAEGYKVEAFVLPAYGVGAPHKRDRVYIVAYTNQNGSLWRQRGLQEATRLERHGSNNGCGTKMSYWETEHQPSICRVADGLPNGMDRLERLGNAVLPQIPEIIGRVIMEIESS